MNPKKISYHQEEQKEIKGALTNKIAKPEQIKQMMLLKAKEKTKLPLSYQTTIGKGTKKDQTYAVPTDKYGYLHAYSPAISEKGQVTFGEVYIQLKGSKKKIIIKKCYKTRNRSVDTNSRSCILFISIKIIERHIPFSNIGICLFKYLQVF